MKEVLFITNLFNMDITAIYVIVLVFVARAFMAKLPKKYSYALWAAVGFRLVCPVSFSWALSLFNLSFLRDLNLNGTMTYIPSDIQYAHTPKVNTGINSVNSAVNWALPEGTPFASVNPIQIILFFAFCLWILGMAVIFVREIYLFVKTKRLVKQAVLYKDNIYFCDNIPSPFVMDIFRPVIYIPFRMKESEMSCIICHEQYHIKRRDNIIKPLSFVLASIHWYNPFVWAAYISMISDMEKSCDEAVITALGEDIKKEYGNTLISFASNRRNFGMLAFGEKNVRGRIKNLLYFKKRGRLTTLICILTVIIVFFVSITNGSIANTEKVYIEKWAAAFSDRNGHIIKAMSSENTDNSLLKEGFYVGETAAEKGYIGWSSPWPMEIGENQRYTVLQARNGKAVVLYYAFVSDPHYTVWRQTLVYEGRGENVVITDTHTDFLDNISTGEEFFMAYPNNIKNTPMDYSSNTMGEIINEQFLKGENYNNVDLSNPENAILYFLNINEKSVKIQTDRENNVAELFFVDDGINVKLKIEQPFGEDGIWIPTEILN